MWRDCGAMPRTARRCSAQLTVVMRQGVMYAFEQLNGIVIAPLSGHDTSEGRKRLANDRARTQSMATTAPG